MRLRKFNRYAKAKLGLDQPTPEMMVCAARSTRAGLPAGVRAGDARAGRCLCCDRSRRAAQDRARQSRRARAIASASAAAARTPAERPAAAPKPAPRQAGASSKSEFASPLCTVAHPDAERQMVLHLRPAARAFSHHLPLAWKRAQAPTRVAKSSSPGYSRSYGRLNVSRRVHRRRTHAGAYEAGKADSSVSFWWSERLCRHSMTSVAATCSILPGIPTRAFMACCSCSFSTP